MVLHQQPTPPAFAMSGREKPRRLQRWRHDRDESTTTLAPQLGLWWDPDPKLFPNHGKSSQVPRGRGCDSSHEVFNLLLSDPRVPLFLFSTEKMERDSKLPTFTNKFTIHIWPLAVFFAVSSLCTAPEANGVVYAKSTKYGRCYTSI